MNQPEMTEQKSPFSFAGGLLIFLLVILISSAPVVIEQLNRSGNQWEPSDGFTADHVNYRSTRAGMEVILAPTEATTREAYFNKATIATDTFRLSTEVDTPNGCHDGLVFRGNAQGEYYLFLVDAISYTVEILTRKANSDLPREAIIPNTPLPQSVGRPHILTVLGDGQSYSFYINNVFVNSIKDSRLSGDRVGVEVFT